MQKARQVLADCRHALDLLEAETSPDNFRVLWVAGVALARAVGHVLQKVDGERDAEVKKAVSAAYASWKMTALETQSLGLHRRRKEPSSQTIRDWLLRRPS